MISDGALLAIILGIMAVLGLPIIILAAWEYTTIVSELWPIMREDLKRKEKDR